MKVINEYWLCEDCTMVSVNGDYTGLDYYLGEEAAAIRAEDIDAGLERLGYICPTDEEDEFSRSECDCCGDSLAGRRMKFVELGE